jgi:hypothetical protein
MEEGLTYYGGAVICESVQAKDKPLIKAAPEMYEVLNALFSWMVEGWPEEWPDEHSITAPLTVGDVRRARALLAKVKGEQPEKGNDK